MPATLLAERARLGLAENLVPGRFKCLRPEFRPINPADQLTWRPADALRCDRWFPPKRSRSKTGTAKLLARVGDHGPAFGCC